ncbi:unnamed protein product [Brassicogethes aeneus]|uniref:Uncharacterized protein n=1 Tax=Brassicogethes aeneus TaxID=1431903 RepID=A0A9P0B2C5_BRAAE|nr:unnamed protein product [Brassicogethes aeneus]
MRQFIVIVFATLYSTSAQNSSFFNKPKRTLIDIQSPGDAKPVGIVYHLPEPQALTYQTTEDPNLGNFYTNTHKFFPQANSAIKPVFETEKQLSSTNVKNAFEAPKVAAQHVLYEYEQTPTNAVSNVHVKHIFQPVNNNNNNNNNDFADEQKKEQNSYIASAETVVSPVQHSSLVNHAQNYAQVNYHPLYSVQPTHNVQHHGGHPYVPSRYLYVNGKIVYQPVHQPHQQQNAQRNHFYHHPHHQHQPSLPLYQNRQQQNIPLVNHRPVQKLTPPPVSFSNFHPPARSEMQRITNPVTPKSVEVEENQEVEEDDKEEVRDDKEEEVEENDDDDDRRSNLEEGEEAEEDDEKHDKYHHLFGKYSFENEDDEDDHQGYRTREEANEEEEEDDEDNDRRSSKHVSSKTKKPNKKSLKKSKSNDKDNYSYSEAYMTSSKYEQKPKKSKNAKSKPKRYYRKVKNSSDSRGKPKYEAIEGKSSQQVPITHEHKFVKEKFYITKSFNDGFEKN